MLRTVADDTPRPAAVTSNDDATGSPDVMYSRTSAASTRFDLSAASCDILELAVSIEDCQPIIQGDRSDHKPKPPWGAG